MARNYIVCATQRSGSSFVCECLAKTGQLGSPQEWLVFLEFPEQESSGSERRLRDGPVGEIVAAQRAKQQKISGQSTSGWKIMGSTMGFLRRHQARPPISNQELFAILQRELDDPKYIYLERLDKIGQAISHVVLQKTLVAHAKSARELASLQQRKSSLVVSDAEVTQNLASLLRDESDWARFFAQTKTEPLPVVYEDFCNDIDDGVRRIAEFLGVSEPMPSIAPGAIAMLKTRNGVEREIARRYLSHVVETARQPAQPSA